jgi:IS30 family transposase
MWPDAIVVRESRQNIRDPQVCCSHCRFHSGNGMIGMDFIVGLPRTLAGYDSIWVVVDRLTKAAHFIPVKTTYNSAVLAELYMSRIVCLHGILKNIISDRGTQFTSHFWQQLHEALGTHLKFSSSYHPQTDGQTERTN